VCKTHIHFNIQASGTYSIHCDLKGTGYFLKPYTCVVAYASEKQRRLIAQNTNQPTVNRRYCTKSCRSEGRSRVRHLAGGSCSCVTSVGSSGQFIH